MKFLKLISILFLIVTISCSNDDDSPALNNNTVVDADGNIYKTIKIGNQIWMAENLKTTKYNDGSDINLYTSDSVDDWWNGNTQTDYYQWAQTEIFSDGEWVTKPVDYYGAMYNHFAIESGKLAPKGWRIPTVEDFIELENFLTSNGAQGNEANVLKTIEDWNNGTNSFNFNGLPNGYIHSQGGPTGAGAISSWATDETIGDIDATRTTVNLMLDNSQIIYSNNLIRLGAGIRCIKE